VIQVKEMGKQDKNMLKSCANKVRMFCF